MSRVVASIPAPHGGLFEGRCGTRAGYVAGCRCEACRAANTARYHERMQRMRVESADVRPTGPAIAGTMRRGGRDVAILRCPGANGAGCVREPGGWLKGREVCGACVERATVWDGLVPADRACAHLLELRRAGIGYKAVADACDVAASALGRILAGESAIRASTERRILAVDAGARADGSRVPARATNAIVRKLRARGFTLQHLAELLGYQGNSPQLGSRRTVTAATAARVERLWRKAQAGEVKPRRDCVGAARERTELAQLVARGASAAWFSQRLGFSLKNRNGGANMRIEHREALRRLLDEVDAMTLTERRAAWPRYRALAEAAS